MEIITQFKYHDKGTDTFNTRKHLHDSEFEILHVIRGSGTMMIKDKLYPLKADTAFFISGSDAHCSFPDIPEKYIRSKIIFSKTFLLQLAEMLDCISLIAELFSEGGSAVLLSPEASSSMDHYMLKVTESLKENKDTVTLHLFLNLFSMLDLGAKSKNHYVPPINNKLSDILSYINQNLDKKLSLDSICRDTMISKSYLCHTFQKVTGMTVGDYILLTRLAKAKHLLTNTSRPISEIALDSGFGSFAYFTKVFREQEGCTPSAFRRT